MGSLQIFSLNIVSLCFAVGAVYIIYLGLDGWGWLIAGSILTGKSIEWDNKEGRIDG